MRYIDDLKELDACEEAIKWCAAHDTLADAWAACERGDWMLWLLAKAGCDRHKLVLIACACARLALPHVPEGELRPLKAIETAESWARGEAGVTLDDVRYAADAAADAASYAADAASYVASYAAYAASHAAYVADAASHAAYVADAATLNRCAMIVRNHVPVAPTIV